MMKYISFTAWLCILALEPKACPCPPS